MAYVKGQPFKPQFIDPNTGLMLSAGTIEFYAGDTTTPTPYYTDSTGTVGGTSLELDAGGKPPTDIFFDTNVTYKLIVKNGAGTPIETLYPFLLGDAGQLTFSAGGVTNTTVQQYLTNLYMDDYSALRALDSSNYADGDLVTVTGEGVSGDFIISTGTVTDNGGTKIVFADDANRYALRRHEGAINIKWFGATGDGTNQQAALTAAINEIVSLGVNDYYLYLPNGHYVYDTEIGENISVLGESKQGTILEFDSPSSGSRAFRIRGWMNTENTAASPNPLAEGSPVSTRAAIDDQDAGLSYVTCSTVGDAANFSVGDVVMVAAGKDPYDADDVALWRYARPAIVTKADASTGKIELSRVITAPLTSDGFEPSSDYYNPAAHVASTSYTIGDVVYGPSAVAAGTNGVFKAAASFTSSTDIDADLAIDSTRWDIICEDLGAAINTSNNDRRPLIQKMDDPCVRPFWKDFQLKLTDGAASLAAFYITSLYEPYINVDIVGDFIMAHIIGGKNGGVILDKSNHLGTNRSGAENRSRYINIWGSDATVRDAAAVSGRDQAGANDQPTILMENFAEILMENTSLNRVYANTNAANISASHGSKIKFGNCKLAGTGRPVGRSGNGSIPANIAGAYDPRFYDSEAISTGGNWLEGTRGSAFIFGQSMANYLNNTLHCMNVDTNQATALNRDNYVFKCDDIEIVEQQIAVAASQTNLNTVGVDSICQAFQGRGNYYVVAFEVYYDSAPASASVDVRPFHAFGGSNFTGLFDSSVGSSGNLLTVTDADPFGRVDNSNTAGSRFLLAARANQFGIRYTSNGSATSGTLHCRFYCIRGNIGEVN